MKINDIIGGLKLNSDTETVAPYFEKFILEQASDVPISLITMKIPASGFATEDGVFLNEDYYEHLINPSNNVKTENIQSIPFQVIHEIAHYRQFQKKGQSLYDGIDGNWDSFKDTTIRVETEADEYAAKIVREINEAAGINKETGLRIQKFDGKFQQFMRVIYMLYTQNKDKYNNYADFQMAMSSGDISLPSPPGLIGEAMQKQMMKAFFSNL